MTRWYRSYEGTVTDPKFGEIAVVAECSRSVALATWGAILETCARLNDGGRFDATPRRVSVILAEPIKTIEAVFAEMRSMGMIREDFVVKWGERQFESDSSTERSRKHRQAKRDAGATLHERRSPVAATAEERRATPPDTDTETDIDNSLRSSSGVASVAEPPDMPPRSNAATPKASRSDRGSRLAEDWRRSFERFWTVWPNKVGKHDAQKAFAKVADKIEAIMAGVDAYVRDKPPDRQWLNPATFLNGRRWEDAPAPTSPPAPQSSRTLGYPNGTSKTASDVARDLAQRFADQERANSHVFAIPGGD